MSGSIKFILLALLLAILIFPIWHFFIQPSYIKIVGRAVTVFNPLFPFGKMELYSSESARITYKIERFGANEITAGVVVDLASIVTNIVPLLALVFATATLFKKRLIGGAIGTLVAFVSHIIAISIILLWQNSGNSRSLEGLKIFTDGIILAGLPILYWSVWAGFAVKGGLNSIFKK